MGFVFWTGPGRYSQIPMASQNPIGTTAFYSLVMPYASKGRFLQLLIGDERDRKSTPTAFCPLKTEDTLGVTTPPSRPPATFCLPRIGLRKALRGRTKHQ